MGPRVGGICSNAERVIFPEDEMIYLAARKVLFFCLLEREFVRRNSSYFSWLNLITRVSKVAPIATLLDCGMNSSMIEV